MKFCCPHCHSPIYSRQNKHCGVCEKPLPEALLMNDNQVVLLKKQMEQDKKRAKEFNLGDLAHGAGD